jgi:hypothetical protein
VKITGYLAVLKVFPEDLKVLKVFSEIKGFKGFTRRPELEYVIVNSKCIDNPKVIQIWQQHLANNARDRQSTYHLYPHAFHHNINFVTNIYKFENIT